MHAGRGPTKNLCIKAGLGRHPQRGWSLLSIVSIAHLVFSRGKPVAELGVTRTVYRSTDRPIIPKPTTSIGGWIRNHERGLKAGSVWVGLPKGIASRTWTSLFGTSKFRQLLGFCRFCKLSNLPTGNPRKIPPEKVGVQSGKAGHPGRSEARSGRARPRLRDVRAEADLDATQNVSPCQFLWGIRYHFAVLGLEPTETEQKVLAKLVFKSDNQPRLSEPHDLTRVATGNGHSPHTP